MGKFTYSTSIYLAPSMCQTEFLALGTVVKGTDEGSVLLECIFQYEVGGRKKESIILNAIKIQGT